MAEKHEGGGRGGRLPKDTGMFLGGVFHSTSGLKQQNKKTKKKKKKKKIEANVRQQQMKHVITKT